MIGSNVDWVSILQTFGLPVALVVFFVIQGAKREERLNSRMEAMEQYIRDKMTELVEDTNQALTRNTEVMSRLERLLERQTQ